MHSGPQRPLIALAVFLIAPALALPSSIEVNSVCEVGTCPLPTDTLAPGSSIPETDFNFTVDVNGDPFDIFGDYSAYNTSNSPSGSVGIALDVTAVYEGSSPTAQDDEIFVEDLQNNTVPGSFSLAGTYGESLTASFDGPVANNTSVRGQMFFNGDGLGTVGPFSGPASQSMSAPLGLTGTILDEDFQVVLDFGKGTQSGSSSTGVVTGSTIAPTPEPTGIIPVAVVLALCLGIPAIRRARLSSDKPSHAPVSGC
jgi:hypothetical protein